MATSRAGSNPAPGTTKKSKTSPQGEVLYFVGTRLFAGGVFIAGRQAEALLKWPAGKEDWSWLRIREEPAQENHDMS